MTVEMRPGVHWLNHCINQADRHMHLSTYLVETSAGHVLIDTGANLHRDIIGEQVESLTKGSGVDTIVLTHSTLEHTANVQDFQQRWGDADVLASTAAPEIMGTPDASEWKIGQTVMLAGDEFSFSQPLLTDNLFTVWVHHHRSDILFTSEAFGRYHTADNCGTFPAPISEDPAAFPNLFKYCADRLKFLKFVQPAEMASRIDETVSDRGVELLAPAHGNPLPVDDLEAYWDTIDDVITGLSYSDSRLAQVEHRRHEEG